MIFYKSNSVKLVFRFRLRNASKIRNHKKGKL